jgi:hypothetical protein
MIPLGAWAGLRLTLPPLFCDDAYITLRAAMNLAAGSGPVLNSGELTLVATSLTHVGALAALIRGGLDPVRGLLGLNLLAEVLLLAGFVALGREATGRWRTGSLAALALLLNPVFLLTSASGIEVSAGLLVVVAACLAWARGRIRLALLAGGIAPWVRPDLVLLPVILTILVLVAYRPRRVIGPLMGMGILVGAAPALVAALTGSPWPRGAAWKLSLAPPPITAEWWEGAGAVLIQLGRAWQGRSAYWYMVDTPWIVLAPLAVVGMVGLARVRGVRGSLRSVPGVSSLMAGGLVPLLPLIAVTGAHAVSLVASGSGYARNFPWYFVPILAPTALLGVVGFEAVVARVVGARRTGLARAILGAGLVAMVGPIVVDAIPRDLAHLRDYTARRELAYAATARTLDELLPQGRAVGAGEIGALGYFAGVDRPILDLVGLGLPPGLRGLALPELLAAASPGALVILDISPEAEPLRRQTAPGYRWTRVDDVWIGLAADVVGEVAVERWRAHRAHLARSVAVLPPIPEASVDRASGHIPLSSGLPLGRAPLSGTGPSLWDRPLSGTGH